MNNIHYEQRAEVYTKAFEIYGKDKQCIVALEELSECQKEICKHLRGNGNMDHLAEEVADATICLEQVRLMFGLNDMVCEKMDEKVKRLINRMVQDVAAYLDGIGALAHGGK